MNGRPWHLRIAVRAFAHKSGADGRDVYNNRVVDFVELRWGRIPRWEAYEDTERSAEVLDHPLEPEADAEHRNPPPHQRVDGARHVEIARRPGSG